MTGQDLQTCSIGTDSRPRHLAWRAVASLDLGGSRLNPSDPLTNRKRTNRGTTVKPTKYILWAACQHRAPLLSLQLRSSPARG
jgi:hypothetical protein